MIFVLADKPKIKNRHVSRGCEIRPSLQCVASNF
jgi:hypothetical protein